MPAQPASPRKVILLAILITIVAAVVVGVAVVSSFHWVIGDNPNWKIDDVSKIAGIWSAFITAAMTATLGIISAVLQSRMGLQLEQSKTELTAKLDGVRNELAGKLEFTKGRYGAERTAYDELVNAATVYYYTLARLESGDWNLLDAEVADRAMIGARRHLRAVDEEHRALWDEFWQEARNVKDAMIAREPSTVTSTGPAAPVQENPVQVASAAVAASTTQVSAPMVADQALRNARVNSWGMYAGQLGLLLQKLEKAAEVRHLEPRLVRPS